MIGVLLQIWKKKMDSLTRNRSEREDGEAVAAYELHGLVGATTGAVTGNVSRIRRSTRCWEEIFFWSLSMETKRKTKKN